MKNLLFALLAESFIKAVRHQYCHPIPTGRGGRAASPSTWSLPLLALLLTMLG